MSRSRKHPQRRSPKAGFALVIALSLMAFVLVLLLSISTLVSVESKSAQTTLSRLEAQQNALLGIYVAVGELQKSVGPDQRVTARAEIFDSDPDTLSADGVQNPFYMGVFQTVEPGHETQDLELLRTWATDVTSVGRVQWLLSSREDLNASSVNPATTDVVDLNGGNANNVVSVASFEDNTGADQQVRVGKVDVISGNSVVSGQYAWWVADESSKFRINQTKPDKILDDIPFEPRLSILAPHRSNPAVVPELSSFAPEDPLLQSKVEKVVSKESLGLIDPSWETWLSANGDDISISSSSLPVDVTQGRLKEDLTVYLETDSSGLSDANHIVRGSSSDVDYEGRLGSGDFSLDYDLLELPRFELLKDWYESGMEVSGFDGGTPQAPRPHTDRQHGLHPVILRTAVYYGVSFEVLPEGQAVLPVYLIYPKFVLWNPHNVPIEPAKYVVQVRSMTTLNTQINIGGVDYAARNVTQGFNYRGNVPQSGTNTFAHLNLANSATAEALERDPDDGFPYLTFVIDNDGFAPGETLLYTGADKHPNSEYVDRAIDDVTADFEDENILVNENESKLGFFYLRGRSSLPAIPGNSGEPIPITSDGDTLRTTFYFRDTLTASPTGSREPSLTTKLYLYDADGSTELLELIDLAGADLASTVNDWEHINTEGWSAQSIYNPLASQFDYQSLSEILDDPFQANFVRGHGYFVQAMGNAGGANKSRVLARQNLIAKKKSVIDPLVSNKTQGRIHGDAPPSSNWFNGAPFPTDIPKDFDYSGLGIDGFDSPGGYGMTEVSVNFILGNTVYPFYERVRAETGLLSLGFLKNVSFSQFYWQPSFPFGQSEAHTHVARDRVFESVSGEDYFDLSYLLNESLWDRYFLSTIPQTGSALNEKTVLPNSTHRLVVDKKGVFPSLSELRNSPTAYKEAAASIQIEGGFNVNSTSTDAWRMFLSSHLGETVQTGDGVASNATSDVPLTAKSFPLIAENNLDNGGPGTWSTVNSLSPNEINALADAVVEEVKRRGPFLSMADFVNRRLVEDSAQPEEDFLGLKGTLQAAIDKVSTSASGSINSNFYQGSFGVDVANAPGNDQYPEHEIGMPESMSGSRFFSAPGFLTQADILSALSPLMTVRGDTFTIRSYGSSQGLISGRPKSQVWCEAVVQRIADPVEEGDSIVQPAGRFGRSFKILQIRWLNEDEVI